MLDRPETFLGRVTFVSGDGKHCGKTTFMNRALALTRGRAEAAVHGSPLIMTVGYDGESRDFLTGARKPAVPVAARDYYVTAERFLRSGGACPEVIDVLPGSSVLGRLAIARATRDGTAALVGPEGNSGVRWVLSRILDAGLSRTAFIDGAINRITQASSRDDAQLVYCLRVDAAGAPKAAALIKRLAILVNLPVDGGDEKSVYRLNDALTAQTAARLPKEARAVSVPDFTSVFLGGPELAAFLREKELLVQRPIRFAGFSVVCRGIADERFAELVAEHSPLISFNPYGWRGKDAA